MAQKAKGWPLSQDEIKASRAILLSKITFESIIQKYSNAIEEIGSSTFTHKSICPKHKNGNERTASFYFSEEDKSFRCFGCGSNGDLFDLIALMEGMPSNSVINLFIKKEDIDIEELDLNFTESNRESFSQYIFNTNLKLSSQLRDYLHILKNKDIYNQEKKWVDLMFRRIDARLSKIKESKEAAKAFEFQVLMELERKKSRLL